MKSGISTIFQKRVILINIKYDGGCPFNALVNIRRMVRKRMKKIISIQQKQYEGYLSFYKTVFLNIPL